MAESVWSATNGAKSGVRNEDSGSTAMRFVLGVIDAFDNTTALGIVKDTSKCKAVFCKLVNKLDPLKVKMRIISERTIWSGDKNGSLQQFMKRTTELAIKVYNGKNACKQIGLTGK